MPADPVRVCQCGPCQQPGPHPDRAYHHHINLLLSRLDEAQRRWFLAVEAERLGPGAERRLGEITGMDDKTLRRGREELAASLAEQPAERVRQAGGGRFPTEKKTR